MREELHCSDLPKSCLKDILSLPESYWVTSRPWNTCELKAFQKLWRRISDTQKRDISRLRVVVHDAPISDDWLVHEVPLTKIRGNLKDKNVQYTFSWSFVLYISSRFENDKGESSNVNQSAPVPRTEQHRIWCMIAKTGSFFHKERMKTVWSSKNLSVHEEFNLV